MNECAWRPKRNRPAQTWDPLHAHSTLGRPKMPFARSHQGQRVHRIRYWWLLWAREDGVVKFRSASAYMWCGQGMGTRGYTIAADVRMVADDASALCVKCFPCEIAERVFETGGLDS